MPSDIVDVAIKSTPKDIVAILSVIATFSAVGIALFVTFFQNLRQKYKDANVFRAGALVLLKSLKENAERYIENYEKEGKIAFEKSHRKNFDNLESLIPLSVSAKKDERKLFLEFLLFFKPYPNICPNNKDPFMDRISELITMLEKRSK